MKSDASMKVRHDFTKEAADRYIKSCLPFSNSTCLHVGQYMMFFLNIFYNPDSSKVALEIEYCSVSLSLIFPEENYHAN